MIHRIKDQSKKSLPWHFISVYIINAKITRPRGDTTLIFECWKIFHSFAPLFNCQAPTCMILSQLNGCDDLVCGLLHRHLNKAIFSVLYAVASNANILWARHGFSRGMDNVTSSKNVCVKSYLCFRRQAVSFSAGGLSSEKDTRPRLTTTWDVETRFCHADKSDKDKATPVQGFHPTGNLAVRKQKFGMCLCVYVWSLSVWPFKWI